jgi:hypothetical protein
VRVIAHGRPDARHILPQRGCLNLRRAPHDLGATFLMEELANPLWAETGCFWPVVHGELELAISWTNSRMVFASSVLNDGKSVRLCALQHHINEGEPEIGPGGSGARCR